MKICQRNRQAMFAATSVAVILAVVAALMLVRGSARTAFAQSGLNLVYVESNISGAMAPARPSATQSSRTVMMGRGI
jgi:hypothetical protein